MFESIVAKQVDPNLIELWKKKEGSYQIRVKFNSKWNSMGQQERRVLLYGLIAAGLIPPQARYAVTALNARIGRI